MTQENEMAQAAHNPLSIEAQHAVARANILARSSVEIRRDRKDREIAYFWSRHTGWTRCGMVEALAALATQAQAGAK